MVTELFIDNESYGELKDIVEVEKNKVLMF